MFNKILDLLDEKYPNGICNYRAKYVITHPRVVIFYYCNRIKWAYQRVKYGYDDRANWDMAFHIANLSIKLLNNLKEDKSGLPIDMYSGFEFDYEHGYTKEQDKIAKERWDKILIDMIIGFESSIKIMDDKYTDDKEFNKLEKKFNNGFNLFKKYFFNLWD